MGTDQLLALIFVGGPMLAIAIWTIWKRAYEKGYAVGKKYACAFMPIPGPRVIRYNAYPVRAERRLDYIELRQMESDERLKEHVIAQLMDEMTRELWKHAKIEEIFDARNCQEVFQATIMLAKREG